MNRPLGITVIKKEENLLLFVCDTENKRILQIEVVLKELLKQAKVQLCKVEIVRDTTPYYPISITSKANEVYYTARLDLSEKMPNSIRDDDGKGDDTIGRSNDQSGSGREDNHDGEGGERPAEHELWGNFNTGNQGGNHEALDAQTQLGMIARLFCYPKGSIFEQKIVDQLATSIRSHVEKGDQREHIAILWDHLYNKERGTLKQNAQVAINATRCQLTVFPGMLVGLTTNATAVELKDTSTYECIRPVVSTEPVVLYGSVESSDTVQVATWGRGAICTYIRTLDGNDEYYIVADPNDPKSGIGNLVAERDCGTYEPKFIVGRLDKSTQQILSPHPSTPPGTTLVDAFLPLMPGSLISSFLEDLEIGMLRFSSSTSANNVEDEIVKTLSALNIGDKTEEEDEYDSANFEFSQELATVLRNPRGSLNEKEIMGHLVQSLNTKEGAAAVIWDQIYNKETGLVKEDVQIAFRGEFKEPGDPNRQFHYGRLVKIENGVISTDLSRISKDAIIRPITPYPTVVYGYPVKDGCIVAVWGVGEICVFETPVEPGREYWVIVHPMSDGIGTIVPREECGNVNSEYIVGLYDHSHEPLSWESIGTESKTVLVRAYLPLLPDDHITALLQFIHKGNFHLPELYDLPAEDPLPSEFETPSDNLPELVELIDPIHTSPVEPLPEEEPLLPNPVDAAREQRRVEANYTLVNVVTKHIGLARSKKGPVVSRLRCSTCGHCRNMCLLEGIGFISGQKRVKCDCCTTGKYSIAFFGCVADMPHYLKHQPKNHHPCNAPKNWY